MKLSLFAAGAFACLTFAAHAEECEFPFDKTVGELAAAGAPVAIVPEADLAALVEKVEEIGGQDSGDVTRAFIAQAGGNVLLGLEVDGCLLPPIVLGLAPAVERRSGKGADGLIGA